jgi:hypothetical protein
MRVTTSCPLFSSLSFPAKSPRKIRLGCCVVCAAKVKGKKSGCNMYSQENRCVGKGGGEGRKKILFPGLSLSFFFFPSLSVSSVAFFCDLFEI